MAVPEVRADKERPALMPARGDFSAVASRETGAMAGTAGTGERLAMVGMAEEALMSYISVAKMMVGIS